jgi:hypothetical protein
LILYKALGLQYAGGEIGEPKKADTENQKIKMHTIHFYNYSAL